MFELAMYVERNRGRVDAALEQCLPPLDTEPRALHEAMRYSVFSGGKRLRPVLCLAAAETVGADGACALLPAAAVELLHTYTLIHDDLPSMDDDDARRGMPTCHIRFGEAHAILAGDALQALAFEMLSRVRPADKAIRMVAELSVAAGSLGVVGGQVADIENTGRALEEDTLDFIHRHKTADLFNAAVRMGAIAGNATDIQLAALTRYARALGIAFQIVDDLLDAREAGTIEECSCVTVLGVEESCRRARQLTEDAIAALHEIGAADMPLEHLARHMAERTY